MSDEDIRYRHRYSRSISMISQLCINKRSSDAMFIDGYYCRHLHDVAPRGSQHSQHYDYMFYDVDNHDLILMTIDWRDHIPPQE